MPPTVLAARSWSVGSQRWDPRVDWGVLQADSGGICSPDSIAGPWRRRYWANRPPSTYVTDFRRRTLAGGPSVPRGPARRAGAGWRTQTTAAPAARRVVAFGWSAERRVVDRGWVRSPESTTRWTRITAARRARGRPAGAGGWGAGCGGLGDGISGLVARLPVARHQSCPRAFAAHGVGQPNRVRKAS
jgi:hypothetical protein